MRSWASGVRQKLCFKESQAETPAHHEGLLLDARLAQDPGQSGQMSAAAHVAGQMSTLVTTKNTADGQLPEQWARDACLEKQITFRAPSRSFTHLALSGPAQRPGAPCTCPRCLRMFPVPTSASSDLCTSSWNACTRPRAAYALFLILPSAWALQAPCNQKNTHDAQSRSGAY